MSSKAGATAGGGDDRQLNQTATSEDGCGTALEMRKKKARRVSFAEMTSVHIFDRDEDTPPESLAKAGKGNGVEENELSFPQFVNLKASDDGEDGDDGNMSDVDGDGELPLRRPFLRPMESPSPGSTIGSATSNDEDRFFGPVSPSFIRPGRLSDSAASADNHDVTMDSTAFSMHFRSLARSESGVDLRTPTGIHLAFEEKTPIHTQGNTMVLTGSKKPISNSSFPAVIASGTSDSSDMSLIGEHSQKYEYGRLSPDLDALLAGEMALDIAPRSNNISASTLPTNEKANHLASKEDGGGPVSLDESGKLEAGAADFHSMPSETLPRKLDKANGAFGVAPLSHATYGSSLPISNPPDSGISVDNGALLSNQLSKDKLICNSMEASIDASQDRRSEKLSSVNRDTLLSPNSRLHVHGHTPHKLKSPLTGFVSPSPAKRRLILTGSTAQKYCSRVISAEDDSFIGKENMVSQVTSASIQRSISKLERLKASAFSSAMGDRIDDVLVRSLEFIKTPPTSSNLEKVNKDLNEKCVDVPIICAEEQFSSVAQIEGQERQAFIMDSESFMALAHDEGKNSSSLISEDPKGKTLFTSRIDSVQAECMGEKQATGTPHIHFSPGKSSEKLSSKLQKFMCIPDGKSRTLDQQKSSSILNEPCEISTDFSWSKNDLSAGVLDSVLYDPSSCLIERNSNEPSLETPASLTHGSGRKDIQPQKLNNSTSLSLTQDLQLATYNILLDGFSNNSAQKRGNNELLVENRESQDEIITLQRSPKLQKYQSADISTCPDEVCSGNLIVGTELKYLSYIKSKFMESADQWASLSIEKLNVHEIDLLQGFIPYMHKSKSYEILHHELLSQKTSTPQNQKEKRIAEARMLMCRVMYEKAKLHLMRVKQEKLQEKFQPISSGVQECKSLKLNSLPQLSTKFAKGLHSDALCLLRSSVNQNGMREVACNKVSTMTQALEVSDRKIMNLNRYFHTYFKIKGELNCNDTIALVKDHMMKRKCCTFFRQEMQMVVIHNTWSSAGHHTVVLNYLGILIQSLKIAAGSTSSIIISNELNDMAIAKNFPNMDACTVFAFVLPVEISRKYVGARSLAQEIQVTQSLLGNLVDVVEEVQLARIELCNLIDNRFCSPTAGELDLQLHLISFKSGIKVKVTLGLSFLNRGIYPWEIIPSVCAARADGTKCTDEPLLSDVENAVKSVKPGYMRIIRLCRCISKAIQSSSR